MALMTCIKVTLHKRYAFTLTKMLNLYQYANDISSILANIPFVLIAYLCFIEYALLDIGSINNNENI